MKRITKNVIAASKLATGPDSNLFYSTEEDNLLKGHALVIAPRYGSESDADIKAAKYPYEECLFFFDIDLPDSGPNYYPVGPPHLFHQTPFFKNYRLHPNLYEHGSVDTYSGKVCLGILGTWGNNDWQSTMSISDVLQGIMGILEANPGTYEPGCGGFTDKSPQGILYNQHAMYESIEITCKVYENVLKCINPQSTSNSVVINASKVASERVPAFLKPFLDPLARRAFSSLGFLIGKIEEFIRVQGKSTLTLATVMHHDGKVVDFGKLKKCLENVRASIPKGLQKNVFKYGMGEVWRSLFELSKPKRNGRNMTYNEFVEEMEQRTRNEKETEKAKKAEELGVTSCPTETKNEENETEYVYNNEYNLNLNQGDEGENE